MKILYVTTIGSTMSFFKTLIRELLDEGHTVDIATSETVKPVPACYREWGCRVFPLPCSRSPLSKGNLTAIKAIRRIVTENGYDLVHCHTPIAAACTRLACRKLRKKKGLKVFYTAHGFHFYKGAPLKNWLIYYPVEKLCAHFTDKLITINHEDFALALKKMKAGEVLYVPGVGINIDRFRDVSVDRSAKRRELGIPEDAVMLFSVGELNENKNHKTVLNAMTRLERKDVHYVIAGIGPKEEALRQQAESLGLGERFHLLGYRSDIAELLTVADAYVFPSYREGLSVSVMEAMANGLPCAVSRIRGNTDLIDENGGAHFDPYRVEECVSAIEEALNGDRNAMAAHNKEKIRIFSQQNVFALMRDIYGC